MTESNKTFRDLALAIRMRSLRMVHQAQASHIGSALSIADILAVLYGKVLNHTSADPKKPNRDRFILSKGHACVAVYAALAEFGYISDEETLTYGQNFSILMNHISHRVPGVEFSTGALGHGLPFGTGKALAAKKSGFNWKTYVLLSDGELDEGSNWEAAMFASHHCLSNLVAVVDYNKLQSLDTVDNTLRLEPLADKFRAFGWDVKEVDGHDYEALERALSTAPWRIDKPSVIIAHTIKGKGVRYMENNVEWHYKAPSTEQLQRAIKDLLDA